MKNDCIDCKERHIGCHATCEKYSRYFIENERRKRNIREHKKIERYKRDTCIREILNRR